MSGDDLEVFGRGKEDAKVNREAVWSCKEAFGNVRGDVKDVKGVVGNRNEVSGNDRGDVGNDKEGFGNDKVVSGDAGGDVIYVKDLESNYCMVYMMKIEDVDTSKIWRIEEYDGAEGIEYFNGVKITDKELNLGEW